MCAKINAPLALKFILTMYCQMCLNLIRQRHKNKPMNQKTKILIVEDDTPLAMMMTHVLTCAGCDVQVADTGKKGLELAQEIHFDLITLDIDLPDANGVSICLKLIQRHVSRKTPVVFVSGRQSEQDMQRGLEAGAVDYIVKPFGMEFAPRLLSHVGQEREISH